MKNKVAQRSVILTINGTNIDTAPLMNQGPHDVHLAKEGPVVRKVMAKS